VTLQYRHALAKALPPWLSGPNARSFYTEGLAVLYDVDRAWLQEALLNRLPSICDPSALPLLLADRRLRRGPYTIELAVRRYLRLWWDQWQLAGLFSGLLLAAQAFLAPEYPQIRIWTRGNASGQLCYTIAKGTTGRALALPGYDPLPPGPDGDLALAERLRWSGTITRAAAPPGTFDYDSISHPGHAARWWHFWMSIHGKPLFSPWQYDSGVIYSDPLKSWGTPYPHGDNATFRQIVRDYAPHETRPHTIILAESEAEFDPGDVNAGNPAFGWPDGQWGWEVVNDGSGGAVDARRTDLRYFHSKEGD
jgi:hypothetical protein